MFDRTMRIGLSACELLAEDRLCERLSEETAVDPAVQRHSLPQGLESMTPNLFLAAIIGCVDRSRLNGYDLIRLLQAESRLVSHFQAARFSSMAEVAICPPGGRDAVVERAGEQMEFASDEIAAALQLTRRAADSELGLAWAVSNQLPEVGEALSRGDIDTPRARVLCEDTSHLDPDLAATVTTELLDRAGDLTTGQLRARVRRACIVADPESAKSRYEQCYSERRVVSQPTPAGTSHLLLLDHSPHLVGAARRRVNRIARELKMNGDPRSIDQLRADVMVDLLRGSDQPASRDRGGVVLTVPLATLLELSEEPGELAGYGPVIADITRQVISQQADTTWSYLVTDDHLPVATGTIRKRPTNSTRRQVQAAHPTCVFPGCRMPAPESDLDHTIERVNGGSNTDRNLKPLCRHHHRARHQAPWTYQPNPDGTITWTSALGHTYTTNGQSP